MIRLELAAELDGPPVERAFVTARRRAVGRMRTAVHSYREAIGWLIGLGPDADSFGRGWRHQAEEALVAYELATVGVSWDAVLAVHRRFYPDPEDSSGRPGDGPTGALLALEDVRWLPTVEGLLAQRRQKVVESLGRALDRYEMSHDLRARYLAGGLRHDPGLSGLEAERARLVAKASALKIEPGSRFGGPPTAAEWSGRATRGPGRLRQLQRWEMVGDHIAALYALVAPAMATLWQERRPHRDSGPVTPAFNRRTAELVARIANLYYGHMWYGSAFARPLRARDVLARLQARGVRAAPRDRRAATPE